MSTTDTPANPHLIGRVFWPIVVCFAALTTGTSGRTADAPPTEAERSTGPFLRVSVNYDAAAPTVDLPADGIVFRIGLAHPYRPGGATPPVTAGHLSRVFSPAPVPPPPTAVVAAAEPMPVADRPDLHELPADAALRTSTLDRLLGNTDRLDDDKQASPGTIESRRQIEQHSTTVPTKRIGDLQCNFYDAGRVWKQTEACLRQNLLKAGEQSTPLDLQLIMPQQQSASSLKPAPDQAVILYIRAFAGPELQAVHVPLRLVLMSAPDAAEPIATGEVASGFFGTRLSGPRGEHPHFDTEESLRLGWREQTQTILASRSGREFFSAPDAQRRGQGTRDDPAPLDVLMQSSGIRPGDTIWLLEGTYPAPGHVHSAPAPEIPQKSVPVKQPDLPDDLGPNVRRASPRLDGLLGSQQPDRKLKTVTRHYFTSTLNGHANNPVIVRHCPATACTLRVG